MATEISVLRAASLPIEVVDPVREHARRCHACMKISHRPVLRAIDGQDTRWCPVAEGLIERALQLFIRGTDWKAR